MTAPRIVVTHPGRQHSHQAALALAKAGMLAGYWAGVPALERHRGAVPERLWRRLVRYPPLPLPAERVAWMPWAPALRRITERLLPAPAAARWDFAACRLFDRWAARRLAAAEADAVIACEISALATFGAARRRGLVTLLDAPSIHHQAQDRLHGFSEPAALHRRITTLKDREIALADHVLTVSPLARATYLEAGVAPERAHAVLLGADLELFAPVADRAPAGEGCRFLFAGAMIRRKGFDLLAAAFPRVRRAVTGARLAIAGPVAGDAAYHLAPLEALGGEAVVHLGPLTQAELAAELRHSECLVLPSRNDSYGMVVAEALATGVPVLVSEMVGSKALVSEGTNGWVIPVDDAAALERRMLWCARHPRELAAMAPACRESAEAATWEAYHRRFAGLIRRLVPPAAA